jgi:hypothetical protein
MMLLEQLQESLEPESLLEVQRIEKVELEMSKRKKFDLRMFVLLYSYN